uniref:galectin-4-like n=1 Tax=Maylandia zebra TaxID=106582 RepID=UPI000D2F9AAB
LGTNTAHGARRQTCVRLGPARKAYATEAKKSTHCRLRIKFLVSRSRDVAFHIHPRFREGIVVRNSMIGGNWGQEEREMSMNPFMEGQYFDMSIRCGNQRFKVFVNGQHLFDFFPSLAVLQ